MKIRVFLLHSTLAGLISFGLASAAQAQAFPNKPVRIVTAAPGGSSDFAARIISQGLPSVLGQPVVVDNRGGGSGIIAIEVVAKAPADGYTVLLYSSGMWILPLLQPVPYDSLKDFAPLTLAILVPSILVVHPSVPVRTVKELIALAKARPGQLNYASGGTGTSTHLGPELLKYMARVNIVRIIYKGGGPAITDLLAGQVQMMFSPASEVINLIKSGKLRALAVTSAKPSPVIPELPTIAETLPGFESVSYTGMFAPAGTPPAIIDRLNQDIVRVLKRQDIKERFFTSGYEVVGSTPEQLAATMKSDIGQLGKMIKEAGIKSD